MVQLPMQSIGAEWYLKVVGEACDSRLERKAFFRRFGEDGEKVPRIANACLLNKDSLGSEHLTGL
jgi:hypothetical protein